MDNIGIHVTLNALQTMRSNLNWLVVWSIFAVLGRNSPTLSDRNIRGFDLFLLSLSLALIRPLTEQIH